MCAVCGPLFLSVSFNLITFNTQLTHISILFTYSNQFKEVERSILNMNRGKFCESINIFFTHIFSETFDECLFLGIEAKYTHQICMSNFIFLSFYKRFESQRCNKLPKLNYKSVGGKTRTGVCFYLTIHFPTAFYCFSIVQIGTSQTWNICLCVVDYYKSDGRTCIFFEFCSSSRCHLSLWLAFYSFDTCTKQLKYSKCWKKCQNRRWCAMHCAYILLRLTNRYPRGKKRKQMFAIEHIQHTRDNESYLIILVEVEQTNESFAMIIQLFEVFLVCVCLNTMRTQSINEFFFRFYSLITKFIWNWTLVTANRIISASVLSV